MKLNLFKPTNKATTVKEILGNDDVKHLLNKFIEQDLGDTDGIILISAKGEHIYIDSANMNEVEAIYALNLALHKILDNRGLVS